MHVVRERSPDSSLYQGFHSRIGTLGLTSPLLQPSQARLLRATCPEPSYPNRQASSGARGTHLGESRRQSCTCSQPNSSSIRRPLARQQLALWLCHFLVYVDKRGVNETRLESPAR
jgi:hypothetical protein